MGYSLGSAGSIVTDGLEICLDPLDIDSYSRSGTVVSNLVSSTTGSLINGPTFNSEGYFELDGSNDYIDLGYVDLSEYADGITVNFWCQIHDDGNNPIFNKYASQNTGIWFETGNEVGFYGASSGWSGIDPITCNDQVGLNKWMNIACTYNKTTMKIYYAGVEQASHNKTGDMVDVNNRDLRIGSLEGVGGWMFKGKVAHYLVYSRGLTASEVLQNFNANRHRFGV